MYFDSATVPIKIRYQYPWRDIFYDLDGTLTGKGTKSWATPYWKHNEQPECSTDRPVYDGILCDSRVQVRRIAFHNYAPSHFDMMDLKLLKIDGTEYNKTNATAVDEYFGDSSNYGIIPWKPKLDPSNAWAVPIVTGHKYKAHWQYGLDFELMQLTLSKRWEATDKGIYFVFNFTDVREKVEVITGGDIIENMTLSNKSATPHLYQTGDNTVYNDTDVREIHLYVNGKNNTRDRLVMKGYRCVSSCLAAIVDVPLETTVRYWSNADSWPKKVLPKEGEDVTIESGWNMIYDLEVSPLLNMLQINGQLTFKQDAPQLHLRAKYIFVRAGKLVIGSPDSPFPGEALITLSGEKANQHMVYTNAIEAGNKILAVTGSVEMYGAKRSQFSRLTKPAQKGDRTLQVATGLDWKDGDKLGIFPTTLKYFEQDYAVVSAYDANTGVVTLDRPLDFYHYGAATSTAAKYGGVDMRGEVVLLTRNVKIVGNDTEAWGCQVVTSDFMEANDVWRTGSLILDSVEIYNCSQYDTFKAAVRFEGNFGSWSKISSSAIHHGLGIGIQFTAGNNVLMKDNTIYNFVRFGVNIQSSSNITIDGNLIGDINSRNLFVLDGAIDVEAGILGCALEEGDRCQDIFILNNIVAGTTTTGYSAYAHECNDYSKKVFFNNTAHSVDGNGAIIFRNPSSDKQGECLEGSFFTAYKCTSAGAVTY